MKTKDLREKSIPELEELLRSCSKELLDLRIRKETGQVEKPHMLNTLRKEVARLQTLLDEKRDTILKEGDLANNISIDLIARRAGVNHRKVLRAIAPASSRDIS